MPEKQDSEKRSKGRDAQKGFLYQDVFSVYLLLDVLDPEKGKFIKEIVVEGVEKRIEDIRVVFSDGTIEYYQVKTKDPPRNWSKTEVMSVIQAFLSEKADDNEKFVFISDNNPDVHCKQLCDTIEKVRNYQHLSGKDKKIIQEMKSLLSTTYQETLEALHKIEIDIGKGKFRSLYENTFHKAGMILGIKSRKEVDKLIRCILAEIFMKSSAEAPWKRKFNRDDIKSLVDYFYHISQETSTTSKRNGLFSAPPKPPYNLVGRDDLLHDLKQQLLAGYDLALYGLPGVGKTALVRELVYDDKVLQHFQDGVLWAAFGREGDVLSHLSSWGAFLGISPYEMTNLTSIEAKAKAIQAAIGMRQMLLVIDDVWEVKKAMNFKLGGPNCVYVVTTRIPEVALLFAGERAKKVDELNEDDGLKLLAQLAPGVVEAEPDEARELVRAVGGLPLAIVLMGNYLRVGTHSGQPRRLRVALKELGKAKKRLQLEQHQGLLERHPSLPLDVPISLKAVINISDEALDEASRRTFRALSVFPSKPNSFSEEAAVAACAEPVETLDTLADKGLLESTEPGRYTLHQVIADYAREKLRDKAARKRMVEFFVSFVETHKTNYEVLDKETANILAALDAAAELEMQAALVQGTNKFYHFLGIRGLYTIAENYLKRAQQAAKSLGDTVGLVKTLYNLGIVLGTLGYFEQEEVCYQEGLNIAREIGDRKNIVSGLMRLGGVELSRGNYTRAERYYQEGLNIASEIGNRERISFLLAGLTSLSYYSGNYTEAEKYSKEGLTIAREIGNRERISFLLAALGWIKIERAEYAQAEEYLQAGLIVARKIGHRDNICKLLRGKGTIAYFNGDYTRAKEYYQESLNIARETGHCENITEGLIRLGTLLSQCGDYTKAEEYLQEGLTMASEIGLRENIIYGLIGLGTLLSQRGDYTKAEEYLQEGLIIAREIGNPSRISSILNIWGDLHLKQQKLDLAYSVFFKSLKTARDIGNQELIAESLYGLARVASAKDNIVEARCRGQESLKIFETIGHKEASKVKKWLTAL